MSNEVLGFQKNVLCIDTVFISTLQFQIYWIPSEGSKIIVKEWNQNRNKQGVNQLPMQNLETHCIAIREHCPENNNTSITLTFVLLMGYHFCVCLYVFYLFFSLSAHVYFNYIRGAWYFGGKSHAEAVQFPRYWDTNYLRATPWGRDQSNRIGRQVHRGFLWVTTEVAVSSSPVYASLSSVSMWEDLPATCGYSRFSHGFSQVGF